MFQKRSLLAAALLCLLLCSCTAAPVDVSTPPVDPPSVSETEGAKTDIPTVTEPVLTPEPPVVETPPVETPSADSTTAPPPVCEHPNTVSGTGLAPTCTTGGQNILLCADCKKEIGASEVPALGHDYRQTAVVEAACETAGSRTLTCTRCGDAQTESIAAPGHNWAEATCGTSATCKNCSATTSTEHSWVVKHIMGTPECERCGTKYTFPDLVVTQSILDVPILVGKKSIRIIDLNWRASAFEGPFTANSPVRLDITVDGIASNACTLTRGSHLVASDGTKINSIYDVHNPTHPVCDGSFTELFSFDLPSAADTYNFVFSAQ